MSEQGFNEFYVTLPSNASSHIFENTTASYTTKLCQPVHLTGDWVVGVTGITIPWSFYNLQHEEEIIIQTRGKKKTEYNIKFPPGYYDSVPRMLESIPRILQDQQHEQGQKEKESENQRILTLLEKILKVTVFNNNHEEGEEDDEGFLLDEESNNDDATAIDDPVMLHYDSTRHQVFIKHRRYRRRQYVIGMTPGLQNIFGFSNDPDVSTRAIHFYPIHRSRRPMILTAVAPYSCNLEYNIPSEINVCLDIVKTQPNIGQLLRKISVHEYQYGQIQSFIFDHPQYVKVEKKYFDTLHVDLKDEHGKKIAISIWNVKHYTSL